MGTHNFFMFFCLCLYWTPVLSQDKNEELLSKREQEAGYPFVQNYTPDDYNAQSTITGQQSDNLWNAGIPFITTYTPEEYKGDSQNWGFVQSENGIIYVANSAGVLEFDGATWRLIQTVNSGTVRSLAKDDDGTIYVGGSREIGYLKPDNQGQLHYASLLTELDPEFHNFTDVWSTYFVKGAVYFISPQYIFKWEKNHFKVFRPSKSFVTDVLFNEEILVIDGGVGLKILREDMLLMAPLGSSISSNLKMFPFDDKRILVVDNSEGTFLYDFESYLPLKKGDPLFKGKKGYQGIHLPNGNFLLVTLGSGVYIFDRKGNIKSHLTTEKGLISDIVYSAFLDKKGDVWLGTASGINHIEISRPIRKFDKRTGITEGVITTEFHQNKIYAGCFNNLLAFDMSSATYSDSPFSRPKWASNISEPFSLLSVGDDLWVGERDISVLRNGNIIQFYNHKGEVTHGYKLIKSMQHNDKLYAANSQGQLYEIYRNEDNWLLSDPLIETKARIHHLTEDERGWVWLATYANGIHKVEGITKEITKSSWSTLKVIKYDTLKGLPGIRQNSVCFVNGIIYAGAEDGLYRYHEDLDTFKRDTLLDKFFPSKEYSCGLIARGIDESLWIPVSSGFDTHVFRLSKGGNIEEIISTRRNSDNQIFNINASQKGITLISGPKGIFLYKEDEGNVNTSLPILNIRKVGLRGDSIIFGGFKNGVSTNLDYQWNDLRFEYALASYDDISRNQYQYLLEGYDKKWSLWSSETRKDYTNLAEGDYSFKVRGKNLYGLVSEISGYNFTILPPWYRTWWAYLSYALGATVVIWIIVYWRSQQLLHKNLALEALVNDRTEEIRLKNEALGKQAEMLKEMDTMKTRLFANISHEFRTPLTLIKGPIEKMEATQENNITTTNIKMIRRNANRLLKLVNQLLDLSKLDSGKLQLNTAEGDVFKCIRAAASVFSSHAASRNIDYQIKLSSGLFWAVFDRDKLENIIYNLLSNAFKFTRDEGRIIIEANYRSNELQLVVSDTGCGIHRDKLPHIFDRFFQVDDSYTKEKTGSGIGLALTSELVQLMKGEIYVESELDKGSKFKIIIPLEEIKSYERNDIEEIPGFIFDEDMEEFPKIEPHQKDVDVLIIEDNNDMRHFIKEQLSLDYKILEARNGKEGLQIAEKAVPALIITDLMMPQMDGISLCKKLKTSIHTSHIPVIMLTAKAGIENKLEGLETGADDYLTKPFNAEELLIRVRNLIAQRKRLRELFSNNLSLDPKEITVTSLDEKFLNDFLALLEEKYNDPAFGVPQMQKELGMSKTHLHSKIKTLTNHPPGELLRIFRLKRAAQLLSQNAGNISQIAYDTGFGSLSHFTKCFKELYDMSPSEYLQKGAE